MEAISEANVVTRVHTPILAPRPGHVKRDVEDVAACATIRKSHRFLVADVVRQITAIGQSLSGIILLCLFDDRLHIEL